MSDDTSKKGPSGWPMAVATIASVAMLSGLAYFGFVRGRAVELSVGNQSISIAGEDDLVDILDKAVEVDPAETHALLATRGYYHIGSLDLLSAIRRFDVDKFDEDPELAQAAAERMRANLLDMMGSLAGPFQARPVGLRSAEDAPPTILWGTSTVFLDALKKLEDALNESEEASQFLSALWTSIANRESVFGLNSFSADVRLLRDTSDEETPRILVCQNNDYLARRDVQLLVEESDADELVLRGWVGGRAERGFAADCDTPRLSAALAGRSVPVRVNVAAARALHADLPEGAELPGRFAATLVVQPGRLTR